jgi:uncharacterized protein YycO
VKRQAFRPVERETVEHYGPGEAPEVTVPGDFVLTHGDAWTSRMIRFGQALRIHGADRKYTYWNHAAMIVGADGSIVEALGAGVKAGNLSGYLRTSYHIVHVGASAADRVQVVRYAESQVGIAYGFLTIVSIGLGLLSGAKFTFDFEGQHICSGLVARSLERTDAMFNRSPEHIMPADLAKYYVVDLVSP